MIDNSTLLTILMGFSEWCSCFAYGDWAARSAATTLPTAESLDLVSEADDPPSHRRETARS